MILDSAMTMSKVYFRSIDVNSYDLNPCDVIIVIFREGL